MTLEPDAFRRVLGHWVTGVAVVATLDPHGAPVGLTANSVASVSLNPPLVLACIDRTADTHAHLEAAGTFAVSILGRDDEALARRFAGDAPAKFADLPWHAAPTGAPVLDTALAWVDCTVHAVHDGGDHSIVVGRVQAAAAQDDEPLVFFRGAYRRLAP